MKYWTVKRFFDDDRLINVSLVKDNVRVTLFHAEEGYQGYYDPDNPEDEPFLRFSIARREDGDWVRFVDGSYCIRVSRHEPVVIQKEVIDYIMDEVYDPASRGLSIKDKAEYLSHITVDWIKNDGIKPKRGG